MDTAAENRYKPTEVESEKCDYRKGATHFEITALCSDCAGCMVMTHSLMTLTMPVQYEMMIQNVEDDPMMCTPIASTTEDIERIQEYALGCPPILAATKFALGTVVNMMDYLPFLYRLFKEYGI